MTSQDHIDTLEREARLASPIARKGGAGRPLAFVGLGLVGALAMSWTLGGASGGQGRMTDPTDEDWIVSTAMLQMPGAVRETDKRGARIVLEAADEEADSNDHAGEDPPTLEAFTPPAPDIALPAVPQDELPEDGRSADATVDGQPEPPRRVGPPMPPFALVARQPMDGPATTDDPVAPASMIASDEEAESVGAQIFDHDVRLPTGMTSVLGSEDLDEDVGAMVPAEDDGRWKRYRSQMVVFDQSTPDAGPDVQDLPVTATSPVPSSFGLFPGDPNR